MTQDVYRTTTSDMNEKPGRVYEGCRCMGQGECDFCRDPNNDGWRNVSTQLNSPRSGRNNNLE